jgi:Zn-finger nucleic acid-binding protein
MLKCPRDGAELEAETHMKIEVDHCPACNGRWLDHHELEHLEATVAHEDHRKGMIDYANNQSELLCPVCSKTMTAFNYRAYNLELDTCEEQHGYWLDAGEEGRVRDVMKERVEGLERAANAEVSWGKFLSGMRNPSMWDNIKNMFGGRR